MKVPLGLPVARRSGTRPIPIGRGRNFNAGIPVCQPRPEESVLSFSGGDTRSQIRQHEEADNLMPFFKGS